MQGTREPYRNILIIKPGAVGDLLQMTPVIRALRCYFSEARITMLVGSALTASLFANDPRVSETIVFDRNSHRSASSMIGLWRMLHSRHFDLILNFQRSNLRTWFLTSAALPCRVLVYHKARNRPVHAVVNYLETLLPLGIAPSDTSLELFLDDASRCFARNLFATHGLDDTPVVALNPGATHAVNRWPAKRFAELADLIAAKSRARVIIVGGPDDTALADEIVKLSRSKPLSITGKTSLLQLGAVLEHCRVLVSGDTGPLHLATAVGTRVIGLFGAADPVRTGPIGSGHQVIRARSVGCVPCRSRSCSNRNYLECMEMISAQQVADVITGMLSGKEPLVRKNEV
jgi:ADP-heptose:LPS heptosyltransferase